MEALSLHAAKHKPWQFVLSAVKAWPNVLKILEGESAQRFYLHYFSRLFQLEKLDVSELLDVVKSDMANWQNAP